ncbi:hypothetical protein ABE501_20730 [Comamonas testosteroni]
MNKHTAENIKNLALESITSLTKILSISQNSTSIEDYEQLRRGVGIAIGEIQCGVLDILYDKFPDIDDLNH